MPFVNFVARVFKEMRFLGLDLAPMGRAFVRLFLYTNRFIP